jgi:AAA+ superfamily predicted ATPase
MSESTSNPLFELELDLPSERLGHLPKRLVGFAQRFERLHNDLRLLIDFDGLTKWSKKHYGSLLPAVQIIKERYPLVIFHGDVGTGKTQTAEVAADLLARELKKEGRLFKLSTGVRGHGMVGQMSTLINQAFQTVTQEAGKSRLSFLIIDEGDSLAGSRDAAQSHHEDKVAVNTLIQKIDDLKKYDGRVLVFLCTNRFGALDPAIVRRAGRIEVFNRPDDHEREALFKMDCEGLGLPDKFIKELVSLTGPNGKHKLGFTFSDIRTRLMPEALSKAYPERKISEDDLRTAAQSLTPSPGVQQN